MWIREHSCIHLEIACILFCLWQFFHFNLQPEQKKKKKKSVWRALLLMHAFSTINSPNFKQNSHLLYAKKHSPFQYSAQLQSYRALCFVCYFVSLLCFVSPQFYPTGETTSHSPKSPGLFFWLSFDVFFASASQRCFKESHTKKLLF